MSGSSGCPECGAEVSFTAPGSLLSVCSHCRSVVAKRGIDYTKLGKVAQLTELPSALRLGLRGGAHGGFTVVGRVQLDHGAGVWNEWYLALDSGRWLWLAETQGRYYLSMPLGVIADAPSFERAQLTRAVALPTAEGERTLRITEVHTAQLVSAEGELPFEVTPGEPQRYADLSGKRRSFATLDYGPPGQSLVYGYYGHQVRLEELKLDQGSVEAAPPRTPRAGQRLSCPQCDGALALLAPDATQRVTCPYCRALVDVSRDPLSVLDTLKPLPADAEPTLALGAKGVLRGHAYTVLGFVRRQQGDADAFAWNEYLLWTGEPSDSAFHYLVESGGHYTLVEPVSYADAADGMGRLGADRLRFVDHYTAKVIHVRGEFPWAVEVGETVMVEDSAAPGVMLSVEKSLGAHEEINASFGHYLDPGEVWTGFALPGKPPPPRDVAPHQPNPFLARLKRQKWLLFLSTLAMFALLFWSCSRGGRDQQSFAIKTVPGVEPAAEHIYISEPFSLGQKGEQFAVEVGLRSLVNNSWVATEVALISEDSGHVFSLGLESAYYHGYDDEGESWSEGGQSADSIIPEVPGGRYVLRLEPSWPMGKSCSYASDCDAAYSCEASHCVKRCVSLEPPPANESLSSDEEAARQRIVRLGLTSCGSGHECVNGQCALSAVTMTVSLRHPTTRVAYAFWLWLLLALVPLYNWWRSRRFEQRRREDN